MNLETHEKGLVGSLKALGFILSSGEKENRHDGKASMHQKPTCFQEVWAGYWVVKRLVGTGRKQRASPETENPGEAPPRCALVTRQRASKVKDIRCQSQQAPLRTEQRTEAGARGRDLPSVAFTSQVPA